MPGNTWKTCLDAKDSYHSIPIAEKDRKHMAFITPWGCYEYLVTPQGHLAAGDGYCQCYDEITGDIKDMKRCVDDTCLWGKTIERNFWKTVDYLHICSSASSAPINFEYLKQ